jgi:X-Pro dipeptidyl-peptidase C-terminal non-catalytic domain
MVFGVERPFVKRPAYSRFTRRGCIGRASPARTETVCDLRHADIGIGQHRPGSLDVVVGEFPRPASSAAGAPGDGKPRSGALPGTDWTRWYLHSDRRLGRETGGDGAAPLVLVADPHDPVPTIGGAVSSGEPVMRGGAFDQRTGPDLFGARPPFGPLCEPADVLSFAIPPLAADIAVVGPVELRLWIGCDAPDADIHAKLVDVHPANEGYPAGFAMNLTEGVLRLRYRASWERPSPMRSDEVYAVTIALFPIANLFQRGHRLRLDLAGSNFPHFDINPNSGEAEGSARQPRVARSRIFVDRSRPSHLILPIVPPGATRWVCRPQQTGGTRLKREPPGHTVIFCQVRVCRRA